MDDLELGQLVRRLPKAWALFHHPDGWMVERVVLSNGREYRDGLSADEDPVVALRKAFGE